MSKRIFTKQAKLPNIRDELIDPDRLTDALARAAQPDMLFQIAPAFEDAVLLGVDDPGPIVIDALETIARSLDPDAVVEHVRAGEDIAPGSLEGLEPVAIAARLINANRRQSIGIYLAGEGNALQKSARATALKQVDLGVASRLSPSADSVPFAIRIPYRGVEAAIEALLAASDGRFSHEGRACDCGLFQLDEANVDRVSILLGGGGGSGAPGGISGTGTPTDIVDSAMTCSFAGLDLDAQFTLHQRETLSRRRIGGVGRLIVESEVSVVIDRILGKNPADFQDQLADGSFGARLLAQLIRPSVAITRNLRERVGDIATGVLEDFADTLSAGAFGTLAAALANDILIPLGIDPDNPPEPIPTAQKLLLDVDSVRVGADRVDIVGGGRSVPRVPRAMIFGRRRQQNGRTRLLARAVLIEMRDTPPGNIVWSSATGTFVGSNIGASVVIEYEQGEALALAMSATDADLQTASIDGVATRFVLSSFFIA